MHKRLVYAVLNVTREKKNVWYYLHFLSHLEIFIKKKKLLKRYKMV